SMHTRMSLARTSAAVVCCHEGAAKRSRPYARRTSAAYGAIGTRPFNAVWMPLDDTYSPGTPLDAQYASARRLRYMLPVQMKWIVISRGISGGTGEERIRSFYPLVPLT